VQVKVDPKIFYMLDKISDPGIALNLEYFEFLG
jgi:hypothetical protein